MPITSSIVYLWSELGGYVFGVLKVLICNGINVDVIHWDKRSVNSTHYNIEESSEVKFHPRTRFNDAKIFDLLVNRMPSLIVVSGWMDNGYINACKKYKALNPSAKVVACIDDQWIGSLRQKFGKVYFAVFYRKLFDFMWVSGPPQFSYAQRFGYGMDNILLNLLSADTELFKGDAAVSRRFVYVGRFVRIKAADLLVAAYQALPQEVQKQWPLVLIGDGELKKDILAVENPNITVLPFMQPPKLRQELLKGGVACMPSHKDQWGVAVHEYALLGLPMLLSTGVGAATEFLINGFNGYLFKKNNLKSLTDRLLQFSLMQDSGLAEFGKNSQTLGYRITNEISAKSLLSALDARFVE